VGDLKEMGAVRDVFSQDIPLISSTKSLTGHSLGAAGAQEAIYALLMMEAGFACESAHIDDIDPEFSDLPILRARKEVQIETAMSNSFGFGGTNATLMFSKV
jgi:3-oxoacyl-[acyl-carrier-protein] synthase-1